MALSGQALAKFAISKIGTPYVYGAKGKALTKTQLNTWKKLYPDIYTTSYYNKALKYVGKVCTDCSGLISWYSGDVKGSYQLYSMAVKRYPFSSIKTAPVGAILWRKGHVGVYIGNDKCVEARGIKYGTIESVASKGTWTHILLLPNYTYDESNPYKEPTTVLKLGSKGEGVKWLQWELQEAGFKNVKYKLADGSYTTKTLEIDGSFGTITLNAVEQYQRSCKITVDGKVGPTTRKCLKNE